jgi:tRNA dimethylallyltransferase
VFIVGKENSDNRRLLVALYGPTSSGKTALSVEAAERIERELGRRAVIISADSRQVYRYMDIGTSKTTAAEMRGIRHELIDVAEPVRKLELEEYARLARGRIWSALADGDLPFVVGGTGVYVKALLEGWATERVGRARNELRRDFPRAMLRDAYAMLRRLDQGAARRVHPDNYEAVINALAALIGRDSETADGRGQAVRSLVLGLDPGARTVEQRLICTYDGQVRRGLFDEVLALDERYGLDRQLRQRGPGSVNQVLHTHGYREYFELALERGTMVSRLTEADLAEVRGRVLEHVQRHTRRQRAFMAKLPGARRVSSPSQAAALVSALATARAVIPRTRFRPGKRYLRG